MSAGACQPHLVRHLSPVSVPKRGCRHVVHLCSFAASASLSCSSRPSTFLRVRVRHLHFTERAYPQTESA